MLYILYGRYRRLGAPSPVYRLVLASRDRRRDETHHGEVRQPAPCPCHLAAVPSEHGVAGALVVTRGRRHLRAKRLRKGFGYRLSVGTHMGRVRFEERVLTPATPPAPPPRIPQTSEVARVFFLF